MARKILVVDDSKLVVVMFKDGLRDHGYEVTTASDGQEALRQVRIQRPDLIILDMNMPVMTGSEFMEELKEIEGNRRIPVILLTANTPAEDIMPDTYGVCSRLLKPVGVADLVAQIRKCLEETPPLKQS